MPECGADARRDSRAHALAEASAVALCSIKVIKAYFVLFLGSIHNNFIGGSVGLAGSHRLRAIPAENPRWWF
jgi:hypothetical protein